MSDAYEKLVRDFAVISRRRSARPDVFTPLLCIVPPPLNRAQLTSIEAHGNTPQKLAVREDIILMLADQVHPSHVARPLGLSSWLNLSAGLARLPAIVTCGGTFKSVAAVEENL